PCELDNNKPPTPRQRRGLEQQPVEQVMKRTKYLSLPQVARRLGCSFTRVLALVRANKIRARLVDHHYWIAEHELRRFRLKTPRPVRPGQTIRAPDVSGQGGCAA